MAAKITQIQVRYRADKLRMAQAAKELTDERLASLAGCGVRAVAQITHGKWNGKLETLVRIADALELPLAELFEKVEAA